MKIEIAEPGRMTQSGSSLLRLIQNNNMPILDLLVRESIQNSLDAKKDDAQYVSVEFKTGIFDHGQLNQELEGITENLNDKFTEAKYKYLAICDTNTMGLTGPLYFDEVVNNKYGNLLKLVYEISKPQDAAGAGGSWGLGKTVYFRIGIGLVLYYSRIINAHGEYESRLVASMVEDELKECTLIPAYEDKTKRGIAWWGKGKDKNVTCPITDEEEIRKILSYFNMQPYSGDTTGTSIIIPYIDEEALLKHNRTENEEFGEVAPYWFNSLEDYIKIAVQRWYAPRLNNSKYKHGKYLRVLINETGISKSNMEPVFEIVQSLYNRAIGHDGLEDILTLGLGNTNVQEIKLNKVLEKTCAGKVAYTKVPSELLKMNSPGNKPSPYIYLNCEVRDKDKNKPIVSYTRKPGMVVAYEDVGAWVDAIPSSSRGEYILAMFVLNSDNKLSEQSEPMYLEEYVRQSEMADHTSWGDHNVAKSNPKIVFKIQNQVKSKIAKEFVEIEENENRVNSGLGKMFGELLLPPQDFGKKASHSNKGSKSNKTVEKHKNVIFTLDNSKTKFTSEGLHTIFKVSSKDLVKFISIELGIDSESGTISTEQWENGIGLAMPFEITKAVVKKCNITDSLSTTILKDCLGGQCEEIEIRNMKSNNGINYGVELELQTPDILDVEIELILKIHRRDLKPQFTFTQDEGSK